MSRDRRGTTAQYSNMTQQIKHIGTACVAWNPQQAITGIVPTQHELHHSPVTYFSRHLPIKHSQLQYPAGAVERHGTLMPAQLCKPSKPRVAYLLNKRVCALPRNRPRDAQAAVRIAPLARWTGPQMKTMTLLAQKVVPMPRRGARLAAARSSSRDDRHPHQRQMPPNRYRTGALTIALKASQQ